MPREYTPSEADLFLQANARTAVEGGPFDLPGFFTGSVATVQDYLEAKYPPYGVVVHASDTFRRTLVWVDASGRTHVIDVDGEPIADEVARAPYESPSGSALEDILGRVSALTDSLPSPQELTTAVLVLGVGLVAFSLLRR